MRHFHGKNRRLLSLFSCLLLLTVLGSNPIVTVAAQESMEKPSFSAELKEVREQKLAVIIDDLGNGMKGTEEIMKMPVKLTVAIMPFLSTTEADARRAHEQGHDVLLHLPMEPKHGNPKWLGPGAILSSMSPEEVRKRVEAAIDNVPYAIGINNHMGSKITGDEKVMSIILDVCRERGLFFIDSRTNYRSVVPKLAEVKGMPEVHNEIFLDDLHTEQHILGQLRKVQEKLMQEGRCVTIGHVGTQGLKTATVLKQFIPELQKQGVTFVGVVDLVQEKQSPELSSPGPGVILP